MTIEERISALEAEVREKKRKDFWDILSVLGGMLVPVAIFFAGQQYATAMKAAEIQSSEAREAGNLQVARAGSRVSQANLLLSAVERLAGEEGPAKRVAISAILLAMPEEGPGIVRDLSRSDPSEEVRGYAADSLAQRKDTLVSRLYDPSGSERLAAYNELLHSWDADPTLPPVLARKAREAVQNADLPGRADGIYNTLVLLSHMKPEATAPNRDDLRLLADQMRPLGPRVADRADKLLARLP
jgi:hypothetical protein